MDIGVAIFIGLAAVMFLGFMCCRPGRVSVGVAPKYHEKGGRQYR